MEENAIFHDPRARQTPARQTSKQPSRQARHATRIHILSGFDPTARYMIERLRERGLVDHVTRIVWKPKRVAVESPPSASGTPLLERLSGKMAERLQGAFMDWHFKRLDRGLCQALFGTDTAPDVAYDDEVEAAAINRKAFARRMRALAPEMTIVNGAPILREPIFSVPSAGTVNVHFGIIPQYRGVSTIFWPIYHDDFDHVGVTLHYMNQRVDAGAVLAHGYPALEPGDNEATIMAKCIRIAVESIDTLARARRANRVIRGKVFEDSGRLFRKRQRHAWQEIELACKLRAGLITIPSRPERVVTYF